MPSVCSASLGYFAVCVYGSSRCVAHIITCQTVDYQSIYIYFAVCVYGSSRCVAHIITCQTVDYQSIYNLDIKK